MYRRTLLAFGALAAPAITPPLARAQSLLSEKSIRIMVGFEAGGGADITARSIAIQLQRRLSRRVAVENRTGAAGALAGEAIMKGPPDGSQLALLSSTTLVSRLGTKDFPFDPIKDIAPVTLVGTFPIAFAVSRSLGVETFGDYLQWLKAGDADRRRIAVSSNIAFVKVLNTLLSESTGETLEGVSYRGAVPMIADLERGRIPATVNTLTSLLPAHRGGRLRILLTTGAQRLAVAHDIPTATELGFPKLNMEEWFAFFVPPKTPAPLVAELNQRLGAVINDPGVVDEVRPIGLDVQTSTPEELTARIEAHQRAWETRMKAAGMEPVN
jgi:tripartite-type tricarboxylate transporter receptor subunit TctC